MARTSSTGISRVRSNVPEPLANRLGPLASEASNVTPAAPSSDVRERFGTAPLLKGRHWRAGLEYLTTRTQRAPRIQ